MRASPGGLRRCPGVTVRRRWRSFFSGQAKLVQEPRNCRWTRRCATMRQTRLQLGNRDLGCLCDPGSNVILVPDQRRCLEPAKLCWSYPTSRFEPLHQLDHAADTDLKNLCRSSSRHATPHGPDHPLAQVVRIGFRHVWLASSPSQQLESHLSTSVNPTKRFHHFGIRSSVANTSPVH